MDSIHADFLKNLDASHVSVFVVCKWFRKHGYQVLLEPIKEAPTREQWQDFSDSGDLFVRKGGTVQLIEVKQISRPFKSKKSWPFSDFIVDGVGNWDRKERKPDAYCVVGPNIECMAIYKIEPGDESSWYQKDGLCPVEKKPKKFYATTTDKVRFTKL